MISTLSVPNAMIGLNGTEVECSERSSLNITSMVVSIDPYHKQRTRWLVL
jgi:hypothetical protein